MSEYLPHERDQIAAAARARSELQQTETIFDDLRAEFLTALVGTDAGASDERERLYLAVKVLDRVRGILRATVAGAIVAEHSAEIRDLLGDKTLV